MENQIKINLKEPPEYGKKVLEFNIASDLALKNPMIEEIMDALRENRFLDEYDEVWARLCIDEVVTNAIRHGNNEDLNKTVQVSLFMEKDSWSIRVEDEGSGFAAKELPSMEDEGYGDAEHGRGIILMQSYMDEIWYYDKGNRVQLKKIKKNFLQKWISKISRFLRLK